MNNFCILPFMSIETSPLGNTRACCLYNDEITDNGNKIALKDSTITEAFNSSGMNELRQKFLRNERPDGCSKCWSVEDAGGISKRIISNQKYVKEYNNSELYKNPKLKFIDLKLGNICNLKCRICGVYSSSKWINDQLKISVNDKDKYVEMNRAGQWPREAETFWEDLKGLANEITSLEITGGEPFLIQEHFDFLRHCVDTGNAHRIDIHYNTNGTQFPQDAIENIWPHFRKVEVAFSIDGLDEEFEFQRYGANWQEVSENIRKFHAVRDTANWLTTQLCMTVSVLNIMSSVDVLEWAETQNFNFLWVNILHDPIHFCVQSLAPDAKIKVKTTLEQQIARLKTQDAVNQLTSLIDFMMTANKERTEQIKKSLTLIDGIRNQDYKQSLPKLARLIDDK